MDSGLASQSRTKTLHKQRRAGQTRLPRSLACLLAWKLRAKKNRERGAKFAALRFTTNRE